MRREIKKTVRSNGTVKRDPVSLFNTYRDYIFNIALDICKSFDLAQDITQEVFIKFLENKAQFPKNSQEEDIKKILRRICINHTLNVMKKNQRRLRYEKNGLKKNGTAAVSSPADNAFENQLLHQHLDDLDDKFRLPLLMRYFEGQKYGRIAETLHVPITTVQNRVRKGLNLLQSRLKKEGLVLSLPVIEIHLGQLGKNSLDLATASSQKISSPEGEGLGQQSFKKISESGASEGWRVVKHSLTGAVLVSAALIIAPTTTTPPEEQTLQPLPKLAQKVKDSSSSFFRPKSQRASQSFEFFKDSEKAVLYQEEVSQEEETFDALAEVKIDRKPSSNKKIETKLLLIKKEEKKDKPKSLLKKKVIKTDDQAHELAPVAIAGPDQKVYDNDHDNQELVLLDGSDSYDPKGTAPEDLQYLWLKNDQLIAIGAQATIPLLRGIHDITLLVTDEDSLTAADTLQVKVAPPTNNFPVAVATYYYVPTGGSSHAVQLDAAGSSDEDLDMLTYTWTNVTDPDQPEELHSGTMSTALVELKGDNHTIELKVTDNGTPPLSAQITFSLKLDKYSPDPVTPPDSVTPSDSTTPPDPATPPDSVINQPPVASATIEPDAIILAGASQKGQVFVDASPSYDPDGVIVAYAWFLTNEEGKLLEESGLKTEELSLDIGVYQLKLCVTDNEGLKDTQVYDLTVTLGSPPQAEINASVEPDYSIDGLHAYRIDLNEFLYLDAWSSSDPEDPAGTGLEYTWEYQRLNDNSWNPGGTDPTYDFSSTDPGFYQIRLQISDAQDNLSEYDTIYVLVQ